MSKTVVDPWQAESDARTLTEHAQIMRDSKRKTAATKVLKQQQKNIGQALKPKAVTRARPKSNKSYT